MRGRRRDRIHARARGTSRRTGARCGPDRLVPSSMRLGTALSERDHETTACRIKGPTRSRRRTGCRRRRLAKRRHRQSSRNQPPDSSSRDAQQIEDRVHERERMRRTPWHVERRHDVIEKPALDAARSVVEAAGDRAGTHRDDEAWDLASPPTPAARRLSSCASAFQRGRGHRHDAAMPPTRSRSAGDRS